MSARSTVLSAPNHPVRGQLGPDVAATVTRKLLRDLPLDDDVAVELGTHRMGEVWPWLELCVRADAVDQDRPDRPGSHLLLSRSAPHPVPGVPCPLPSVWGVPFVRVILGSALDRRQPDPIRAVDLFRSGHGTVGHLRDVADRATPGQRCYP